MAKKKETEKTITIELPKLNVRTLKCRIVGDTPLIMNKWSEKAKKEMLDKQMKKAGAGKREAKDPEQQFEDATYYISNGKKPKFGFPAIAFKMAAVNACRNLDGIPMTLARQVFHVNADHGDLVEIKGERRMREDMVKLQGKIADLRYRPEFVDWSTDLSIRYDANMFSEAQIINLFNTAGFACGIGEWRPNRSGNFGMFHIATEKEVA